MANNLTKQYRYERKFIAPTDELIELQQTVRSLPGFFEILHPPRRVNNLYFDSPYLDDFISTVNGEKKRHKVRLRWYGPMLSNNINSTQLEIKIKSDQANTKKIAVIENGDSTDLPKWVAQIAENKLLPREMYESLAMRRPTLLNSYYRHYFGSVDGKFRLTLDLDICYQSVSHKACPVGKLVREEHTSIIELKYDVDSQQGLPAITTALPYRLSRNSKYRNGIVRLMELGYI
jgi:hypothetical protein